MDSLKRPASPAAEPARKGRRNRRSRNKEKAEKDGQTALFTSTHTLRNPLGSAKADNALLSAALTSTITTKDTINDASRALSQIQEPFSLAEQQRLVQEYEASERSYVNLIQEKTTQVQRLMQSIDDSVSKLRRVRIIKANALETIKRQEVCGVNGNIAMYQEGWLETGGRPRRYETMKRQETFGMNGNVTMYQEGWSEVGGRPKNNDSEEDMEHDMDGDQGTDGFESVNSEPIAHGRHGQQRPFSRDEYKRYGRQLIMPEIGLQGQLHLKSSSILIVGVGGLGCPAAAYLAGAGVGRIGLVDGDTVELSNLHRQIIHSTKTIGEFKVDSAVQYLTNLNPAISYLPHHEHLTPSNALFIFSSYDLILDCTDHPTSRYLISDTCVLLQKRLISASALRTDGQLMVLNNPPAPQGDSTGGPCYRCVFPTPPPAETVMSCGEGGILGPVVGVMGMLQALEAIKLITSGGHSLSTDPIVAPPPSLLIFSASSPQPFRTVRLRSRRKNCAACSSTASINLESLTSGSLDYVQFCGVVTPVNILSSGERITATEYAQTRHNPGILIDVREKVQFDICNLPSSINIPYSEIASWNHDIAVDEKSQNGPIGLRQLRTSLQDMPSHAAPITVICRLGNDSQLAVQKLKTLKLADGGRRRIVDVKGGWRAWREEVDIEWPDY